MTRTKTATAFGALVIACATPALAADDKPTCEGGYSVTDVDGNGIVTKIEMNAYAEKDLAAMDADGSGTVSKEEYVNCRNVMAGEATKPMERTEADMMALDANEDGLVDAHEYMSGATTTRAAAMEGDTDAEARAGRLILVLEEEQMPNLADMSEDEYAARAAMLFTTLDTDQTADISREEFLEMAPPVMDISEVLNREFDAADTDGNNELTTTELLKQNANKASAAANLAGDSDTGANDVGQPVVYYRYPSTM